MIKEVQNYLKQSLKIEDNIKIVVALSGGSDSFCLLEVLKSLNYQVIIAHVNHHQREASDIEESYIKEYAKKNNIPCEVLQYYYQENGNFHNEAHQARYQFFYSIAKKYGAKYIATAHHAKDNLETTIYNLMSGSNLYGYAGIHGIVLYHEVFLIRPLLKTPKKEIMEFINEKHIHYFEDSSNNENHYERNRIRHLIIPSIEAECPKIYDKLSEHAAILEEAFELIRFESTKYLCENHDNIHISSFNEFKAAIKKDIICLLLEKNAIKASFKLINNILAIINSKKPNIIQSLNNQLSLIKAYDLVYISKVKETDLFYTLDFLEDLIIPTIGRFYFTKTLPNNTSNYLKICYNTLLWPLVIRHRKKGDIILLKPGHKKIKDVFIDLKIPMEERNKALILSDDKEVLWIVGIKRSAKFKLEEGEYYLVFEGVNYDD